MKKTFFYLAMAVATAISLTACSSDDDDDNGGGGSSSGKSAIVTPKYTEQACNVKPNTPIEMGSGYALQAIDLSESGRCYLTLKTPDNDAKCFNGNYKVNGDKFELNGKLLYGSFKMTKGAKSRAGEGVTLVVNITITLPDGTKLSADTDLQGGIDAIKSIPGYNGSTGDPDIISTWKVRGMIIDLKGDVTAFKTFSNGDLRNVRDEAEKQGAEFTASERKDFEKTIEYVTVKKDVITIDYSDGTSDEGSWSWAGSKAEEFNLKMLSKNYGNKFIVEQSKAGVEWQKANGYLNIKLEAKISGSKNYTAYLTLQLVQAAEVK